MSLKEQISKDYITAFKSKDTVAKTILGVLKGSIQTEEKNLSQENLSDQDVLKILNKQVKSLNESISVAGDEESKLQLEVVSKYLPKQMSKDEIVAKINELRQSNENLNIGMVMKAFAGEQVDRKLVAEIFNS